MALYAMARHTTRTAWTHPAPQRVRNILCKCVVGCALGKNTIVFSWMFNPLESSSITHPPALCAARVQMCVLLDVSQFLFDAGTKKKVLSAGRIIGWVGRMSQAACSTRKKKKEKPLLARALL